MKKKICLMLIFLVILLSSLAIYRINKRENANLKKITVADATITSLTVAIA